MAKSKTMFVCQECGYESPKWMGKCPGCGDWNTLNEEIKEADPAKGQRSSSSPLRAAHPIKIGGVEDIEQQRLTSDISELDRVLGGGFVPGSVVLLGGDPGIGKSTLSLQVAGLFATSTFEVLYVTGEESLGQIKMRAQRLGIDASEVMVLTETSLERVEQLIKERKPGLAILDSIQTLVTDRLTSSPGSVAQLREVTGVLTQLAKGLGIPFILIGHVTKEGAIAGPKVLEHMVDTVLYFEGQQGMNYRILRAVKNRYGSTNEIGVFEMRGDGLHEITNPSAMFLQERPEGASGSAVVPIVEGSRPLLVEVQALVSPRNYGPPRVNALGVDQTRVILLINILEKRTGLQVGGQDVFVNVAGGVKVVETAGDLGVAAAILSSFLDKQIPDGTLLFGELGLAGEVRAVAQAPSRIMEAQKLGFKRVILPKGNQVGLEDEWASNKNKPEIQIEYVRTLQETIRALFGSELGVQRPQQRQGGGDGQRGQGGQGGQGQRGGQGRGQGGRGGGYQNQRPQAQREPSNPPQGLHVEYFDEDDDPDY